MKNIEIELKYKVFDERLRKQILQDDFIVSKIVSESDKILDMHAIYLDTDDLELSNSRKMLRLRDENNRSFATFKYDVNTESNKHRRYEKEVEVDSEQFLKKTDLELFEDDFLSSLKGKLKPIFSIDTRRYIELIEYRDSLIEYAFDIGSMDVLGNIIEFMEIELELKAGSESDLLEIGKYLWYNFPIIKEQRSKYQRCMIALHNAIEDI